MAEEQNIHRSSFEGGLNTDLAKNIVNSNQYVDANNVTLINTGDFLVLEDIKGTSKIKDIITNTNTTTVLRAYPTKYKLNDTQGLEGITIFTHTEDPIGSANLYKISAYIFQTDTIYNLYEETVDDDFLVNGGTQYSETNERVIDGVLYPENGTDILYFTDFFGRPKKLKCEIPSTYAGTAFLVAEDLDLLKTPALGKITLNDITTGGSLLTGTYQLAYQLYNNISNKYSGFSLLETPYHIYAVNNGVTTAGIGLASDKKIIIDITPTEAESAYYTHFRVAVVENIGSTTTVTTNVGVTSLAPIANITGYEILSNAQYAYTTIDELVIDLAAIEQVKTLAIKDNRLLFGNVIVKDLVYDNGTPAITSGVIAQQVATGNSAEDCVFVSTYKGYFRDEVYRFAISYFDANGNFSAPKVLDLSTVEDNQITGGIDLKFPKRSGYFGTTYYSIMDSSDRMRNLGLTLTDITGHPTWAKGYVILRAKRKKNIKFQTPLIPMTQLFGLGTVGEYPTNFEIRGGGSVIQTDTTLSPPGPNSTFVPFNMFYGGFTTTDGYTTAASGSGLNEILVGESTALQFATQTKFVMFFPQKNIYENTPETYIGTEKFAPADAILCELYVNKNYTSSFDLGEEIDLDMSGSFFTTTDSLHFFDSTHTGLKATSDLRLLDYEVPITNVTNFDNYDEGRDLNGSSIGDSTKVIVQGTPFCGIPTNQRCAVAPFSGTTILSGNNAPLPAFTGGTPTLVSTSGDYPVSNEFVVNTTGLYTNKCNIIEINNVVVGLDDNRYGGADSYNEFIYTGTKVVFTDDEVATYIQTSTDLPPGVNLSVWGGDCFVSPHTFKISDTVPTIINQDKQSITNGATVSYIAGFWRKAWPVVSGTSSTRAAICMPAFYDRAAQYITVILESEYNGAVVDYTINDVVYTTGNDINIYGGPTSVLASLPRPYSYNINLNKENDQRIFPSIDPLVDVITKYKSRIYYSDLKIYQTDIEGFDTVRVNNIYDLPETYGAITKLAVTGDRLYSLQRGGVAILPVGERIIETTDTSQLAVRSGEFLGSPVYVDTLRGCQHIASVVNTGTMLYFLDAANKAVCALDGTVKPISGSGLSSALRNLSSNFIIDRAIVGAFDATRDQYYIVNKLGSNRFAYVWNQGLQRWESNIVFPELGFGDAISVNNKFLIIGKDTSQSYTSIHEANAGNYSQFMGTYSQPYVKFIVNTNPDTSKVYDALLVNTNAPISTLSGLVSTERNGVTASASTTAFDITRGEGNYKVKIGRNTSGATDADSFFIERLRGPYAIVQLNWGYDTAATRTTPVNISSVLTKFRPSANLF